MSEALTEKQGRAFHLREQGWSFAKIAEEMGNSPINARELYNTAVFKMAGNLEWSDGLSIRATRVLIEAGARSKDDAISLIGELRGRDGCGKKTLREILEWCGEAENANA